MIPEPLKRPLRDWVWRKLGLSWRLESGVAIDVRSLGDWYIYNELFAGGEYDLPLRELIVSCTAARGERLAVFDLGANVGFFFLRWLHLWREAGSPGDPPVFFLVEGSSRCCAEMRRRLASQPLDGIDVRVLHNLAGRKTGDSILSDRPVHFSNTLLPGGGQGERVAFADIEALARGFGGVPLVKCDIEGSEELFLEHHPGLLARADALAVELHHDLCDTRRCRELILASGLTGETALREAPGFRVALFRRDRRPTGAG